MTNNRDQLHTMKAIWRMANSLERIEKSIVEQNNQNTTKSDDFNKIITLCEDFEEQYGWQDFKELVQTICEMEY